MSASPARSEADALAAEGPLTFGIRTSWPSRAAFTPRSSKASRPSESSSVVVPMASPLDGHERLMGSVRLVDAEAFAGLPTPLPRCQDLPTHFFAKPEADGAIISVSHAWRSQLHPDPKGRAQRTLSELLRRLPATGGKSRLFLDFVSVPQRPWRAGQPERTRAEATRFRGAIRCMHEMYFYSDYVVHLPWEEEDLEGEGESCEVPAACLEGRRLLQVGGRVQVAPEAAGGALQAFDVVASVDGKAVTRAEQLAGRSGGTAVLRRYPFGLPNPVPANLRGWVFLERFITMVKCAMMEEEAAARVVLTPSPLVFQEIMAGAERLRAAAREASRKGEASELKAVLEAFLQELASKHFSAASADKREMEERSAKRALAGDRELVTGIMREFVQHLGQYWGEEAAVQHGLAARAAQAAAATKELLVRWQAFSEEYAERLEAASEKGGMLAPLAKVLLAPLPSLAICLLPVEDPDVPVRKQLVWWIAAYPSMFALALTNLPLCFTGIYGVPCTKALLRAIAAWGVILVLVWEATLLLLGSLWVWPLPLMNLLSMVVLTPTPVPLWWALPKEKRRSRDFQKRMAFSLLHYLVVCGLNGMVFPLVNALLPSMGKGMQALFLCNYLGGKVFLELSGSMLSRRLGADIMPSLVFEVALAYELNVCISFLQMSNPFVVVVQVCFNVLENAYHAWSLSRLSLSKKQEQSLVCMLITREFLELLVPLQFMLAYLLLLRVRPQNSAISCLRSEAEVTRNLNYLLVSISTELPVTLLTMHWLRRRGHRPLALLRGLLATRPFFWRISANLWLLFLAYQHSHSGNDLSLTFLWLQKDAEWLCGNTWWLPRKA